MSPLLYQAELRRRENNEGVIANRPPLFTLVAGAGFEPATFGL